MPEKRFQDSTSYMLTSFDDVVQMGGDGAGAAPRPPQPCRFMKAEAGVGFKTSYDFLQGVRFVGFYIWEPAGGLRGAPFGFCLESYSSSTYLHTGA